MMAIFFPPCGYAQGDDATQVEKIYIIGGANVYEEALSSNYCQTIELTTIYSDGEFDSVHHQPQWWWGAIYHESILIIRSRSNGRGGGRSSRSVSIVVFNACVLCVLFGMSWPI